MVKKPIAKKTTKEKTSKPLANADKLKVGKLKGDTQKVETLKAAILKELTPKESALKASLSQSSKKDAPSAKPMSESEIEDELDQAEEELGEIEHALNHNDEDEKDVQIKASKPIAALKKGDKIKVDALNLEVDAHAILIDHGSTKEMAIECFDPKTDKDYQLRYFSDQMERTMEFYELQEIMYIRRPVNKIEW